MNQPPNIRYVKHESKLLEDNPMGDPYVRHFPVYVPPGYDPKRSEPYPIVYLLAGWAGRGARYINDEGVFLPSLPQTFDEMIHKKQMHPVIVAFPDCGTKFGASQYVNSTANGPYMDYLCDEIVPFIDGEFHTHKSREFRGIAGHSSGGFGALVTSMIRSDCFASVCSSAGDSWFEYLYTTCIPTMIKLIHEAGGVEKFIKEFFLKPNPLGLSSQDQGETMMNLSMCSCYTPNLSVPVLKGDLYFDLHTGELIPEVWKKFLAWDPVYMVDEHVESIKKLTWIHLEAGSEDEYGLHIGHRQISKKFKNHGIEHVIEEYPGRHGGHHYRFGERIKRMLERMYT